MKHRSFTLVEIMVALVILLILVTLGIPTLKNAYENASAKVCETNLLTIKSGWDIYKMEHDTMPGSLSEIPYEYFERAYAKIVQEKDGWKIRLADFVVGLKERGLAYAEPLMSKLVKGQRKLLICPADKREQANKISYCINSKVKGLSIEDAEDAVVSEVLFIDCKGSDATGNSEFDGLSDPIVSTRHKEYSVVGTPESYAQGVSAGGVVEVQTTAGGAGEDVPVTSGAGGGGSETYSAPNTAAGTGISTTAGKSGGRYKSKHLPKCKEYCFESSRVNCKGNKWQRHNKNSRSECETEQHTHCINLFCH